MPTVTIPVAYQSPNVGSSSPFFQSGFVNRRLQDWCIFWEYANQTSIIGAPYLRSIYPDGLTAQNTSGPASLVACDNRPNITVTSYDSLGLTFTYEPFDDNGDLTFTVFWNTGELGGGTNPIYNSFKSALIEGLTPPLALGEFSPPAAPTLGPPVPINAPDNYRVFFGDRLGQGGTLSYRYYVAGLKAGQLATTNLVSRGTAVVAQAADDWASPGINTSVTYTEVEVDYSHPALIYGAEDQLCSDHLAPNLPQNTGNAYYGGLFNFAYDANLTETHQIGTTLPNFRIKDSLGRVSAWLRLSDDEPIPYVDYGFYGLGFKTVTAIRFRDFENLSIGSGAGTETEPVNFEDEDFVLKLNAPASFAPGYNPFYPDGVTPVGLQDTVEYRLYREVDLFGTPTYQMVEQIIASDVHEITSIHVEGEGNYYLYAAARIGMSGITDGSLAADRAHVVRFYFTVESNTPFLVHPSGELMAARKTGSSTEIIVYNGPPTNSRTRGTIADVTPISIARRNGDRQLEGDYANGTGEIYLGAKTLDGARLFQSIDNGREFTAMAQAFDSTYRTQDFEIMFGNLAGAVATKDGKIWFRRSFNSGASWEMEAENPAMPRYIEVADVMGGMKSLSLKQHTVNGKAKLTITDSTTCRFDSIDTGATWSAIT